MEENPRQGLPKDDTWARAPNPLLPLVSRTSESLQGQATIFVSSVGRKNFSVKRYHKKLPWLEFFIGELLEVDLGEKNRRV